MTIPYDVFTAEFLRKISEFDFINMPEEDSTRIVDSYLKRAVSNSIFKKAIKYDFVGGSDDETRCFDVDIDEDRLDEVVDIVTEGMIVHWLKPFVYQQDLLRNVINTRDFSVYSPAELLLRIGNAYSKAQKDYVQMIREYSYDHGDLTDLHI